ncbi:MAG: WD40 repeat domain-containing protein [Planctomycetota bacterium]|jgi:WD40 repeat protein
MRFQHPLGITAGVCLWLASSLVTQTAAPCAEFPPQKQSLAIPVSLAGKPANSVRCVVTLGPTVPASAVALSPDGKKLAVGGYQEVLIWDLENATLAKRLGAGQMGTVGGLAFLGDGQLAVGEGTPYGSGAVRVFDVETGKQTHGFEEPAEVVYCLAVSPDGKLLAAGGADAVARVWSIEDKKPVATLEKHTDWVLGVSFSRDGKLLATAGADRNVWVWDVATWESSVKLRENETVHGAAFGSDANILLLAVGGPSQQALQLRRRNNTRYRRPISTGAGMPLDVVAAVKANRVYVPCSDGTVKVYDDRNGRLLATLSGHEDWVYCVALNGDQSRVASGSGDGTVKLWNAANGRLLATLVHLGPKTDDWLILTSRGHFAASSPSALRWKVAGSDTLPEELTGGLDSPDKVREVLAKGDQAAAPPRTKPRPKPRPKKRPPKKQKADS